VFRNLSTVGLPLTGRPSELIELALSFGFDAMDIDLVDFQQQAEAFGAEHARRLMVSARLKTGVFSLPIDLAGDDETFSREEAGGCEERGSTEGRRHASARIRRPLVPEFPRSHPQAARGGRGAAGKEWRHAWSRGRS
jgi:hypothetical protein